MKRISLLRHGQAEPLPGADFDRNLTKPGRDSIVSLAQKGSHILGHPDRVFTSPAIRALSTAELFISTSGLSLSPEIRDELYAAEMEALLELAAGLPEELESVLIIGHNPSLEEFIEEISGRHLHLKPANLCIMDLEIPGWADLYSPIETTRLVIIAPNKQSG